MLCRARRVPEQHVRRDRWNAERVHRLPVRQHERRGSDDVRVQRRLHQLGIRHLAHVHRCGMPPSAATLRREASALRG